MSPNERLPGKGSEIFWKSFPATTRASRGEFRALRNTGGGGASSMIQGVPIGLVDDPPCIVGPVAKQPCRATGSTLQVSTNPIGTIQGKDSPSHEPGNATQGFKATKDCFPLIHERFESMGFSGRFMAPMCVHLLEVQAPHEPEGRAGCPHPAARLAERLGKSRRGEDTAPYLP